MWIEFSDSLKRSKPQETSGEYVARGMSCREWELNGNL